ncbi:MAG: helix-turn-helix domain-containing protein [Nostoc sp.]|uniref:helix-turn-helix domain-containing protein n=1 Tax=Nostoc sp. TaxID=1180 RepID=UPI002FFA2263
MGTRLRVFLTSEQDRSLLKLRTADVPQKVKDRAEVIRLNAHGWYVEKIAVHLNWTPQTVREVLHKWQKLGLEGLWELPGRGVKPKLTEVDIRFLEECLKKEPRTYNSRQLTEKLERVGAARRRHRFGLGKQIKREMLIFLLVFQIGRDQE